MNGDDFGTRKTQRRETILNGVTIILILISAVSVGLVFTSPQDEAFTEFYLLTENESGELVASNYPKQFTVGESSELVVGITSHENEPSSYTVVVQLDRVLQNGDSPTVVEQESVDVFNTRVEDGETWQQPHTVTPTIVGERLRLTYLLYRGPPPETPTVDNAYREIHLWISVTSE